MSRKFLQIITYSMCCLTVLYGESKATCGNFSIVPVTNIVFGPWFSVNYISCKDQKKKLVRQKYGTNDALEATDAEFGSHLVIGHMGTNEDWYPDLKVGDYAQLYCSNVPAECGRNPSPHKNAIPNVRSSAGKAPKTEKSKLP